MKKTLLILTLFVNVSAFANTLSYTNYSGCTVDVEYFKNGVTYNVSQSQQNETISITHDLNAGAFTYCDKSATQIQSFNDKYGDQIILSCSEHQNDLGSTKGKVEMTLIGGELKRIAVNGQIKRLFRWRQDVKIECLNLVRK